MLLTGVDLGLLTMAVGGIFYWSVGDDQISRGVGIADFTILIVAGLAVTAAGVAAFRRADLN